MGQSASMLEKHWNHRIEYQSVRKQSLRSELRGIERKAEELLNRIVDACSPTMIQAYEKRIDKLEQEKRLVAEKMGPIKNGPLGAVCNWRAWRDSNSRPTGSKPVTLSS